MALALDTLAYARRLREAGFTEQQAEGQAEALAAAMTDTLATKQDLQELEVRVDARFAATRHDLRELEARLEVRFTGLDSRFAGVDARLDSMGRHFDTRLIEMEKRLDYRLEASIANLERRVTVRMLAGIGAFAALVKLT
jgi:hypothetical protein